MIILKKIWLSLIAIIILLPLIYFLIIFLTEQIQTQPETSTPSPTPITYEDYCAVYETNKCSAFFSDTEDIKICEQTLNLINIIKNKDINKCSTFSNPTQCKVLLSLDKAYCFESLGSENKNCQLIYFIDNPSDIKNAPKEDRNSLYFWSALIHNNPNLCSEIENNELIFDIKTEGTCKTIITGNKTFCIDYYKG